MAIEKVTLSSGKEIHVHYSDEGEPEKVSWFGEPELSESEIYDIQAVLEDDND